MPAIARKTDLVSTGHACAGTTTLNTPAQSTVFVEGQLVACQGDPTVSHTILVGDDCVPHVEFVNGATSSVKIGGISAAKVGDGCDAGTITSGASSVFIG